MSTTNQHEIFRLSAILYADNNYEVSTSTIHKKIIESALLENGNREMSITQLILFINSKYGILLDESDVQKVLSSSKSTAFDSRQSNGDVLLKLNKKRELTLKAKVSNSIGDYIIEFEKIFGIQAQNIIHRYLYELFQTNITSFQHLFRPAEQTEKSLDKSIKVESLSFVESEKEAINSFLNWDNPGKNKAIFDLTSLALEYSVLTNKTNKLDFVNLRNKQFYLDANVVYRALGINGKERQELTKTFLSKFNQVGEKLLISIATESEFKDSIKFHVDNIRRHNNPRVSSQLFTEVSINEEIYNYYHKWRTNKVNANTDLFLAHVYNSYEELKKELSIVVDDAYPYDKQDTTVAEQLKQMASEIYNYKTEGGTGYNSATVDAENILWIETIREKKNKNINETVFFFISTDQILRKWDYLRTNTVPIVMLPSQWLSILLRFVERSNDDYKSFVSFLNLRSNEVLIDGEKLQIVLEGISEITTDLDTQRYLVGILVENKFKDVIDGVRSNEILEKSKQFAKTETDKLVEELRAKTESLGSEVDTLADTVESQKSSFNILAESNKDQISKTKSQLSEAINKYNALIIQRRGEYVDKQICRWRVPVYLLLILSVIVILFLILALCNVDFQWNFISKLFKYTDGHESETVKNICIAIYSAAILGLLGFTSRIAYKRFNRKDTKAKRNELELEFSEKELEATF